MQGFSRIKNFTKKQTVSSVSLVTRGLGTAPALGSRRLIDDSMRFRVRELVELAENGLEINQ